MSSKPKITPRLVIIEGNDKGKVIPIRGGTAIIGRSKGDVVVQDARISRSHLAIHFDETSGKLTFTDLKSLNGTQVNGENREVGELLDGDRVQLGNTLFDCQIIGGTDSGTNGGSPAEKSSDSREFSVSFPNEPRHVETPGRHPEPAPQPAVASHARASDKSPSLWARYRNLPPRRRTIYAGCGLALLAVIIFSPMKRQSSAEKPRDLSSVRELESLGRLDEARTFAEELLKREPSNAEAYAVLGSIYLNQGRLSNAIENFKKSLDLNPKSGAVLARLTRAYLTSGKTEEAGQTNREMDQLFIDGPHSKEFFVEAARLYLDFDGLKIPAEKMIILGQALQNKFAPEDSSGIKLEAKGHIIKKNSAVAIPILEKGKNRFPQDQQFLLYLVLAKVEMGDFTGADEVILDWTTHFPKATQPLLFLAEESLAKKEYVNSMKYLQRIVELSNGKGDEPTLRIAYHRMAKIYVMNNQIADAQTALRRSCDMGFRASCDDELLRAPPPPNPLK